MFGIGLAFGPLLIGFMIDAVGWRGVYALFALLSAGVLLIGTVSLPATEKSEPRTPDNLGLTLFTLALMLFTASLMVIPARGFIPDHAGLAHRVGGCSWRLSYAAGG